MDEIARFKCELDERLTISLVDLETRLKAQVKELVQPTVSRVSLLMSGLSDVRDQIDANARGIQDVSLQQTLTTGQLSAIGNFREELNRWDQQRRDHVAQVDGKVQAMAHQLEGSKIFLEQKEAALNQMQRNLERIVAEVNRVASETDSEREQSQARFDKLSGKISLATNEIDIRIKGLELKHNALMDEVAGEETGIARMSGEVMKIKSMLGHVEAAVAAVHEKKADKEQLDMVRNEVKKMVSKANVNVESMQRAVGNVVADVQEHFKTASHAIAAHNAKFVEEIREDYKAELASTAKLRGEAEAFMRQTDNSIDSLSARVTEVDTKATEFAVEAREERAVMNRQRKIDKSSLDVEIGALTRKFAGVFESSEAVLAGHEHMYSIVKMLLESSMISASLEQQDFIDRKSIALIGLKHEDSKRWRSGAETDRGIGNRLPTVSEGQGESRRSSLMGDLSARKQSPAIQLDKRCLSCSPSSALVIQSFKIACLQYLPSEVEHEGKKHSRDGLINKRVRQLEEAHMRLTMGSLKQPDEFMNHP